MGTEKVELGKTEAVARQELLKMEQEEQKLMTEKRHLENDQGKGDREKREHAKELQNLYDQIRYCTQDINAKEKQIEVNVSAEADLQHKIDTLRYFEISVIHRDGSDLIPG